MPTVLELDEIKALLDTPQLIEEIEAGFVLYSEGRVNVPPVGFLHFDDPPGDVHIKYGFISGGDYYVLKMASGFYDNPVLDLPVADGVILVFSQKTGELKLILLDKCWLTDMRTAAAGAVAAKHLAPKTVHHIGIVGTGVQARMQLEMLRTVVDCRSCYVWGRDATKVQGMLDDLRASESIQAWGLDVQAAATLDDLVAGTWTDLSSLVPSGMTPYYLTVKRDKLYLAIFNHESPGSGDCILQFTPINTPLTSEGISR